MSKDVEVDAEKVLISSDQANNGVEGDEEEDEPEEAAEDQLENGTDQNVKLLAMEDLVPITQTLITPSLARLLNLNVHAQPDQRQLHRQCLSLEEFRQAEGSRAAALIHSEEQRQTVQLEEHHASKPEKADSTLSSGDEACLQMMMGALMNGNNGYTAQIRGAGQKRSHSNAGMEGYIPVHDQLGEDGAEDDQAEDIFAMNHFTERENSSNSGEGAGSVGGGDGGSGNGGARTLKRPRLVWTPQLHKRFVDAVTHLGIKNAVPKTIMQLMNVEGLTRENVASHLQKYRLYLRRVQQGNIFSATCANSPTKSVLSGIDHHRLIAAAPLSPAQSSDHLFSSLTSVSASNNLHHQHHLLHNSTHSNPVLPPASYMQTLLLPQPHHQLNPSMAASGAVIKTPPAFPHHQPIQPAQRFSSGSSTHRSPWPASQSSFMDLNALQHAASNSASCTVGGSTASSPPKQALTLFPH